MVFFFNFFQRNTNRARLIYSKPTRYTQKTLFLCFYLETLPVILEIVNSSLCFEMATAALPPRRMGHHPALSLRRFLLKLF